jgi:hypothetical protein
MRVPRPLRVTELTEAIMHNEFPSSRLLSPYMEPACYSVFLVQLALLLRVSFRMSGRFDQHPCNGVQSFVARSILGIAREVAFPAGFMLLAGFSFATIDGAGDAESLVQRTGALPGSLEAHQLFANGTAETLKNLL